MARRLPERDATKRPLAGSAPVASTKVRSRDSSTDLFLAAAGVVLAVGCALLPWYIFFNQDQFGIRALKFEGGDTRAAAGAGTAPRSRLSHEPPQVPQLTAPPADELDALATGTLAARREDLPALPGLEEQPFPSDASDFRLIHVANGRALIEDRKGIWLVHTGSVLPDNSRVSGIEQRNGGWVLLTSDGRAVEISD